MNNTPLPFGEASTVLSRDGTRIAYHTLGQGPSVMVVPGVLSTAANYARFADALSRRFTVHTVERRGRGLSGPQGKDYSVLKEQEDVLAVQEASGATFLVGHSFGGLIALEAARTQRLFSRIATYEPGVSIGGSINMNWIHTYQQKLLQGKSLDAFVEFIRGTGPKRAQRTPSWLMKFLLPRLVKPDELRELLSLLPENLREHQALAALDSTHHHYRDVAAEVLLLRGGRDPLDWVEPTIRQLSEVLLHAEVQVYPTLDHFGLDKGAPEEVARTVGHFFLR
ncbi:alpha/beta fold hydrolase [Deinococcus hopiensis]|uniref:Pimeloyl-ACP methyl ester carboxylesterase n=1 Tax=Deinococcus hopiensis KR-140 TaxID=695939 RepID=A0A1W1UT27_9DEIO|nr:alpha/beta hydrolase [Deinococcus hopiensis]SMB84159.1 Pimeloyl-ACP methyl ester carboxylesterase [Deinococcus hopiensis KR-140]